MLRWVIIRIDNKYFDSIKQQLRKYFPKSKVYVPKVKIITGRFKNKIVLSKVPALFDYGFVSLPVEVIEDRDKLNDLKDKITGLKSWVYNIDGKLSYIKHKEIIILKDNLNKYSIFNKSDLKKVSVGDHIYLKHYPFENLPARVVAINFNTEKVKVELLVESNMMKVMSIDFANIFYSVYYDSTDDVSNDVLKYNQLNT